MIGTGAPGDSLMHPESDVPDPLPSLPPRQQQVAELVAQGKRESEIADALGISIHTVKVHKTLIYKKLGVRNAVELTLALRAA